MLLNIRHETVFRYPRPVRYSIQQLRLTPRSEITQRAVNWHITAPGRQSRLTDAYGNVAHVLTWAEPHDEIRIVVSGTVETVDEGGHVLQDRRGAVSPLAYLAETPLTRADDAVRELARRYLGRGRARLDELRELMPAVCDGAAVMDRSAALAAAEASRQEGAASSNHTHLFIACCRAHSIPARYVSGYVGLSRGSGMSNHAWADAWIEEFGWVSFDVAHQRLAGREHCRLAVGRDHLDACPVRSLNQGPEKTTISVSVAQ